MSRHLGRPQLDLALRLRSARALPWCYRCRLAAMGLPSATVVATLRGIRSLDAWPVAWTATAQLFLAETRRPETEASDDRDPDLARARQRAAFCYHVAHWFAYRDRKAIRTLRSAAVTLFARSAPALLPGLAPVRVPWRGKDLPGYLRLPADATPPLPLVTFLNGVTTSKEELSLWGDAFLARGQAVLAFDQPGTGEAAELGRPSADHDDLSDVILDFAMSRPDLDERQVALLGISLGGAQAVLAAAQDRRIAAVVAVTPPYEPLDWFPYVNPVVLDQVVGFAGGETALPFMLDEFSLAGAASRLRAPLLVAGAGRDVVVPPAEAIRLAAEAGDLGTLLWYGDAGHALYEAIPWWTADAAAWLEAVFAPAADSPAASTQVDATEAIVPTPAAEASTEDPSPSLAVQDDGDAATPASSGRVAHG